MSDTLTVLLKIALVIFMAGNLLDMGLRLNPKEALRGLRDPRFVVFTLVWGFVLGPALAWAVTRVVPLETPWAVGLLLLGMAPCAPFLPMIVEKAKGDLGYTAAFMMLTAVGTVAFMPFAVPALVEGLTVGAWAIAKPLVVVVLLPLAVGMATLQASPALAARVQPVVKKITGVATLATAVLCVVVYGKGLLGVPGSLAVLAQVLFFAPVTLLAYWLGFGLPHGKKIVLSAGMATRNLGAAMAPLFSAADIDQRAMVMVVLGLPIMVAFAFLAGRLFGPKAAPVAAASGR